MNVFFDIQGALLAGDIPRLHAREVFSELASLGHDVYLWSSAGAGYAASAADLLGVEELVLGCYSKLADPPVTVDYAVDDLPSFVQRYDGYAIPPFHGDPEDRELRKLVAKLPAALD